VRYRREVVLSVLGALFFAVVMTWTLHPGSAVTFLVAALFFFVPLLALYLLIQVGTAANREERARNRRAGFKDPSI
jgi:hypothetical protein